MPPIIKTRLVVKDLHIEIEPSWSTISLTIKNVTKFALNATKTLVRWGFNHITVMENILY